MRTAVHHQCSNPRFDSAWQVVVPHYRYGVSLELVDASDDAVVGRAALSVMGLLQREADASWGPSPGTPGTPAAAAPAAGSSGTSGTPGGTPCRRLPLLPPEGDGESSPLDAGPLGRPIGHLDVLCAFREDPRVLSALAPRPLPPPPPPDFQIEIMRKEVRRAQLLLRFLGGLREPYDRLVGWEDPRASGAALALLLYATLFADAEYFAAAPPIALLILLLANRRRRSDGSFRADWVRGGDLPAGPEGGVGGGGGGVDLAVLRIAIVGLRRFPMAATRVRVRAVLGGTSQGGTPQGGTPQGGTLSFPVGATPLASVTANGRAHFGDQSHAAAFPFLSEALQSLRAPRYDAAPPSAAAAAGQPERPEDTDLYADRWARQSPLPAGAPPLVRGGDPSLQFPVLKYSRTAPWEDHPAFLELQVAPDDGAARALAARLPLRALAAAPGRAVAAWLPLFEDFEKDRKSSENEENKNSKNGGGGGGGGGGARGEVFVRCALVTRGERRPCAGEAEAVRCAEAIVYRSGRGVGGGGGAERAEGGGGTSGYFGLKAYAVQVQNTLGWALDQVERAHLLFTWAHPSKTQYLLLATAALALVLLVVPTRHLLLLLGLSQFARPLYRRGGPTTTGPSSGAPGSTTAPGSSPTTTGPSPGAPGSTTAPSSAPTRAGPLTFLRNLWLSLPTHDDLRRIYASEHLAEKARRDAARASALRLAASQGLWRAQWQGAVRRRGNGSESWADAYLILAGSLLAWWDSEARMEAEEPPRGAIWLKGHAGVTDPSPTEIRNLKSRGVDVARVVAVFGQAAEERWTGRRGPPMHRQAMLCATPAEAERLAAAVRGAVAYKLE